MDLVDHGAAMRTRWLCCRSRSQGNRAVWIQSSNPEIRPRTRHPESSEGSEDGKKGRHWNHARGATSRRAPEQWWNRESESNSAGTVSVHESSFRIEIGQTNPQWSHNLPLACNLCRNPNRHLQGRTRWMNSIWEKEREEVQSNITWARWVHPVPEATICRSKQARP